MNKHASDEQIRAELEKIPSDPGNMGQSILRSSYNMARQKGLSAKEAFRLGVRGARDKYADFKPKVTDAAFFDWSE